MHKRDCVFVGTCTYVPMDARAYGPACRLQTYVFKRAAFHMYALYDHCMEKTLAPPSLSKGKVL